MVVDDNAMSIPMLKGDVKVDTISLEQCVTLTTFVMVRRVARLSSFTCTTACSWRFLKKSRPSTFDARVAVLLPYSVGTWLFSKALIIYH